MTQTILPFKTKKTNELITPQGGIALYIEMYRGTKVYQNVRGLFPKPGNSNGYNSNAYVLSILVLFLCGGKYIEDIKKIKLDRALRKVGKLTHIPSADAIGNWLRKDSFSKIIALEKISRRLMKRFVKQLKKKEHILDIDAFEIIANKYTAKYTYKKENKGYMPIAGHLADCDLCIGYEFREGNASPNHRNLEFLKHCFNNMPTGHKITEVRIDSAGYQVGIFNWLEQKGVKFTITGVMTKSMKTEIALVNNWKKFKNKSGYFTDREYAETYANMDGTDYFRVIIQRWKNPKPALFENSEYCYHIICTNYSKEAKSAREVIFFHNGRANSENYYKELKQSFNLDYLPCDDFKANAIWFAIGLLAYNFHIFAKEYLLPKSFRKMTFRSIRFHIVHIAAKVINHAGKLWLKFAGVTDEFIYMFEQARRKCCAYAVP